MKPSRTSLRASIDRLAQDLVRELFDAVRQASFAELDEVLSTPGSRRPLAALPTTQTDASPHDALAELTPRQRSIFERALHGSRNADIARDLGISVKTVETHRAEVNRKLGVRSTPELVRFGAARGLLNAPGEGGAPPARSGAPAPAPMFDLAQVERLTIGAAMGAAEGDRDRAAGLLGISRSALDSKLRPLKPAAAASTRPPAPLVQMPVRRTKRPGRPTSVRQGGSSIHLAAPVESFSGAVILDPAAVLGTTEPVREVRPTLLAPVPFRRAPSRSTRRSRDASIVASSSTSVAEPRAVATLSVRAGEEILRAALGGVVLRRRPKVAGNDPPPG